MNTAALPPAAADRTGPRTEPVVGQSAGLSTDDRVALALLRLQQSRAQLRAAMLPPPDTAATGPGSAFPRRWRALWRAWTRRGPLSGLSAVADSAAGALRGWWRSQPWHSTTEWAGRAVLGEAAPLVRRHPLLAVALGAGLGAAVVLAKPWRWQALTRRVRPMGGSLLRWTLAQLSQVPVQMALAGLLAQFVGDRARGQAATGGAGDAPAPAAAADAGAARAHGAV